MNGERVATGVYGFDKAIEGGFPKGSLIILAGAAGTGKTSFASQFVCFGANQVKDNPVYVSFSESEEQFVENRTKHFGRSCNDCLVKKRCKFLDFTTVRKEGVSLVLEEILKAIRNQGAKRLVVDSFSAISQAVNEKIESRIIGHTVMNKIARQIGCTTILIMEMPTGTEGIGEGVEEFISDGVIMLRKKEIAGYLMRDLEISKMRGTRFPQHKYMISLEGGFKVFPPFNIKKIQNKKRFKPIPEEDERFSTGNKNLDKMLEGGYPKGSLVLLETDSKVSFEHLRVLIFPTLANFLSQERGLMLIPPSGHNSESTVKTLIEDYGIPVGKINDLVRGFQFTIGGSNMKYVINFGQDSEEDFKTYVANETYLKNRTGKTPLHLVGLDTLEANQDTKDVIKRMMMFNTAIKANKGLSIVLCSSSLKDIKQRAANTADIHLKIIREHGALLLFVKKGTRTPLICMEEDVSAGYPLAKFTPII